MKIKKGGEIVSAFLEAVGTAVTGVIAWGTQLLTAVETALATSFLLQIAVGISAVFLGIILVKGIVSMVKSFARK
jgi:hypothetical protein